MNDSTGVGADTPLLLDTVLPTFRLTRMESVIVDADPRTVYAAARDLDLLSIHSPFFDLVTRARGLADRLRGRTPARLPSMRVADLFDSAAEGGRPWVGLGEEPGRELVFGAIGKVGKPTIEWRPTAPEDFPAFGEPDWAKIAASFVVHPYGEHRALLTYETRTACTGAESVARFGRYWAFVSPGVGVVLRTTLRAVKAAAESNVPSRD